MSRTTYATFADFARANPLFVPNRFGGKCLECGEFVPAGKGNVVRKGRKHGKGTTHHVGHHPVVGECSAHTEAGR